jgi:hypothetical protein
MVQGKGELELSILFRVLLLVISTGTLFFVLIRIRKAQVQIGSAVFWILFMLALVVISVFPDIVTFISDLLGIESPANFVFLCIIFILLLKVFSLSLQISRLRYQTQQLSQIIALNEQQKEQ